MMMLMMLMLMMMMMLRAYCVLLPQPDGQPVAATHNSAMSLPLSAACAFSTLMATAVLRQVP
jgi:hypothetical protein